MCFGKIEGGVEVGSSENLVTSQCCTIQQNPARDKIQITFHAYLVSKTFLCVVQKKYFAPSPFGSCFFYYFLSFKVKSLFLK